MLNYYGYKRCSTCSKGEKFLSQHNIDFQFIDITINPPTIEQLATIITQSGQPIKKFFNTSGVVYREMQLKDKIKTMSDNDMMTLLASNGKLLKRPIVTNGEKSTVAFKEDEFTKAWL